MDIIGSSKLLRKSTQKEVADIPEEQKLRRDNLNTKEIMKGNLRFCSWLLAHFHNRKMHIF